MEDNWVRQACINVLISSTLIFFGLIKFSGFEKDMVKVYVLVIASINFSAMGLVLSYL